MQALLPGTRKLPANPLSHRDETLHDAVTQVLKSSGYRSLAALSCRVDRGVVELGGVVSTFYLKQLAQETVLRLDQVHQVNNRVQVI